MSGIPLEIIFQILLFLDTKAVTRGPYSGTEWSGRQRCMRDVSIFILALGKRANTSPVAWLLMILEMEVVHDTTPKSWVIGNTTWGNSHWN